MNTYFFEMTDTFGGEKNYCWIKRFKVTAKSYTHAVSKVSRETGYHFRNIARQYDMKEWKAKKACVVLYESSHELTEEEQQNFKELS